MVMTFGPYLNVRLTYEKIYQFTEQNSPILDGLITNELFSSDWREGKKERRIFTTRPFLLNLCH